MMSSDSGSSTLFNLDQLYLPIPESSFNMSSHSFSTSGGRWRACLNQIAIAALLPWLQEELTPRARVWTNPATLPSFWEFVNGTAIDLGDQRIVLIPSDTIDTDELRIPQEWVDIPTWAADYYLGVQVNSDEGWVHVWGYTTHQQLKTMGDYDSSDRAYSLNETDVYHDLSGLVLARELPFTDTLRAAIPALPTLSLAQVTQLIDRLGNSEVVLARQAIPFPLWGALLAHGGWRKQLYERRQGLAESWSVPQWLESTLSTLAQQIGWSSAELQLAPVRGLRSIPVVGITRSLQIEDHSYQLQIMPLEEQSTPEALVWRFELRSADPQGEIPAGFKLRLLTEDLQPFENNEDEATSTIDRLYIDVILQPGEGIVWEIEPTPAGYDREILKF